MFIKSGKKTKAWNRDRIKLKAIYAEKGITYCEIKLEGCWTDYALGFAHKHKRSWYNTRPELLGTFNETLLACNQCHQKIEYNKELTDYYFNKLRP